MSRRDYRMSLDLGMHDVWGEVSFAALIMTAYRRADSFNAAKLRAAFPAICSELQERYDAPGGYLPGENAVIDERSELARRLDRDYDDSLDEVAREFGVDLGSDDA